MSQLDYDLWDGVGIQLRDFKYKKKYLTPERYIADNPLDCLVVPEGIEQFFGTKVCNIFIVGVPYGWTQGTDTWTESWPPEGLEEAIAYHKEVYDQFTWYETHIYMDMNIVKKIMEANPDSKFQEMMTKVGQRLTTMCEDLADYGFTMEADITTEVGAEFFQPVIDAFNKASANVS